MMYAKLAYKQVRRKANRLTAYSEYLRNEDKLCLREFV